ncbi:hypothetical protein N9484_01580 [Polaribacter sp.]|nr:hypothetical protein [Polaribacter sp.]
MKRSISFLKLNHTIIEAVNGEEALLYLKKPPRLPDSDFPNLNVKTFFIENRGKYSFLLKE